MSTWRRQMQTGLPEARLEQVALKRIDLQDKRFAVAYPREVDQGLVASVRDFGLFLPLILLEDKQGLFRVVAGNRRVAAAKEARIDSVPARVIPSTRDDRALFLLNVRENAATREMNDMERSMILRRLVRDFDGGEKEALAVMPLLGLASSRRALAPYLTLERLLPELKDYAVARSIPLRVSSKAAAWREEDQRALLGLLQRVQLSGNTLNEILDLLEELALRDHVTVSEVFARKEVREVMDAPRFTPTQSKEKLKKRLLAMRYPMLSKRTEEVLALLKEGKPPADVRLTPPPCLEGSSLHLSFSFGTLRELREKAEGIEALASRDEIGEVLRLLQVRKER